MIFVNLIPEECKKPQLSAADIERFWMKIDRREDNECWPWIAGTDWDGYGHFAIGPSQRQVSFRAHRLAFFLQHGHWPKIALHSCDNPSCCNPSHLSDGTQAENRRDCVTKKRHAFGERNAQAKLTEELVRKIKIMAADPSRRTKISIARDLGVSWNAVQQVLLGRTWRHV